MVQDFQTEAAKFSDDVKILTTDLVPRMSSACHVSDGSFEVPLINDDSYIDSIFNLAVRENIGLIIPTIDTELQKLADERERFEAAGIHIVVSDSDFITQCRDKRKNRRPVCALRHTLARNLRPREVGFPLLHQTLRRQPRHRRQTNRHARLPDT